MKFSHLIIIVAVLEETQLQLLEDHIHSRSIAQDVNFYCAQPARSEFVKVLVGDTAAGEKLNTSLLLAFIIHGYWNSIEDSYYTDISNDYMQYVSSNFCVVDWKYLARLSYSLSVLQVERVGNYTGDFIQFLLDMKYFTIDDVRIFGFSLGAHAAGFAGARLNGSVPLIIGLDPAGPSFTKNSADVLNKRLNPSDAQFVMAIHTDKVNFGSDVPVGHADYYPNDANNPQPGCTISSVGLANIISCSHSKAHDYFLASLNPANAFVGTQCSSYADYLISSCAFNPQDTFGIYSNLNVTGKLYLKTTGNYPYVYNAVGQKLLSPIAELN